MCANMRTPLRYNGKEQQPEDADQTIIHTPYGRGLTIRTRKSDDIKEVQLLEWESFANLRRKPSMMYTPVDYPSVPPRVGDDVVCKYGRGKVLQISRVSSTDVIKYTIALSSWRLNGRSNVTCHVISPPPRVVRKHTPSEMDAYEKVDSAKALKVKANGYFSQKDYSSALNTFASAVDAVRNVQHDSSSTNEVRADLVVMMVTCSNNAATCCIKLEKYDEASKFAKNSLILTDALYRKRGKNIHAVLNKEGIIDSKLFGEWRVKSYLVVARSCMEEGEVLDAISVLKKARDVAMGYIDELNAKQIREQDKEEKASLKSLTSQVKEIRRLLVECSDKKKATKQIEMRRAKAMFAGDKENASPTDTNKRKDKKQREESSVNTDRDSNASDNTASDQEVKIQKSKKDDGSRPTPRKTVSFSKIPPQVQEIESTADEDDAPWYSEHKEALIMLAVAGFSAAALMALRRSSR